MNMWRALWLLAAILCACVELSLQAKRDYYEILGLDRKATTHQIKKAFRKQAAKYHPDKNKDPGAEEKFKEINEAHEVLMNPDKRRQYDMFGHESGPGSSGPQYSQHSQHGAGGFTFHFDGSEDMIRDFFGHEFGGEKPAFHFNQRDFHSRHSQGHHQQHNFFSFNDLFEEDEPGFGDFFGGAEPHRFGSGSSFFGSHFGGGHHAQPSHGQWAHAQSSGSRCKTVTQRVGNVVTTYTQCS